MAVRTHSSLGGILFLLTFLSHILLGACEHGKPLQYSHDFLFLLRDSGKGIVDSSSALPTEINQLNPSTGNRSWSSRPKRTRKRGRHSGLRQRLKRQGHHRIPLPTVILANAQSLRNKVEELQGNVRYLAEYRDTCVLALTETWLKEHDPSPDLEIDGFGVPYLLDRDPAVTGKSLGRGVCLYVNKNWCTTVVVRETLCTKDIELLSVLLLPHYLPREFPQLFITLVYIHPKANADVATRAMLKTVQRLQEIAPDAPQFILGDFNHYKPSKSLCNFYQYMTCPTRHVKCLDLCFGSIKRAYKSFRRAPLGMSDHSAVYLVPSYKSVLKRNKPERRLVPVWSEESIYCLQDCLHDTDWDLFRNVCEDLDELTDVVSSYVSFCESSIIPRKEISLYPHNKPWVTKGVKKNN